VHHILGNAYFSLGTLAVQKNFFVPIVPMKPFEKALVFPGVDVMITIFCDFCQFSAKKVAFFSKTNVMIKISHNLALF
jgi:hypothetical protein